MVTNRVDLQDLTRRFRPTKVKHLRKGVMLYRNHRWYLVEDLTRQHHVTRVKLRDQQYWLRFENPDQVVTVVPRKYLQP